VLDQIEQRGLPPVQIIEHDNDGCELGGAFEQLAHRPRDLGRRRHRRLLTDQHIDRGSDLRIAGHEASGTRTPVLRVEQLPGHRDLGNLEGQAEALNCLGIVQQETGNYTAVATSQQQALALFGDLGNPEGQAEALNCLGVVQRESGDYPAAAASHQQALATFREFGDRLGQAEALNGLGELSSRTSATGQAREYHAQALAIARDLCAPLQEARALEGLGQTHLHDGNPGHAAAHLQQALTIYQRIGAPATQRVQETLHNHKLTSTNPKSQPAAPTGEAHQPHPPAAPQQAG
jgi:tetratricopeptide (TPR) repeat protein